MPGLAPIGACRITAFAIAALFTHLDDNNIYDIVTIFFMNIFNEQTVTFLHYL